MGFFVCFLSGSVCLLVVVCFFTRYLYICCMFVLFIYSQDQYIFLHEAVFIALLMSGATVPTSALLAASNTDDNLELESRILTEYQVCKYIYKHDLILDYRLFTVFIY